ncbi:signal transduction histidine kinase [Actinoplanes octamycinicus]|uniref:histidine kinase n=1 Tax=Actinoplanes octamycinicus TaxID=135948 RepID=A0A7W7MAS5_9ACTN|nr:histidine kinase [Actinoplanes octamycinicus]MBB4743297.1 signal transduction histidine kinase [Actinoplanes octamycinicus]GIE61812.1 histidine kinase [Actinoplanes octamycinicus]
MPETRLTARSSGAYLLAALLAGVVSLAALPVLCVPPVARGWARWHGRRAGRLVSAPQGSRPDVIRTRRALLWLPVSAVTGLTMGLYGLLVVGNIVTAGIATALWWAFPPDAGPRLFLDIPVTSWPVALTLGPLQGGMLVVVAYLSFPMVAREHARVCLATVSQSAAEQLAERVVVLTRTRAEVLDAHGAELRRIERDLHDGTQARLVAIAMRLAVARQAFAEEPRDDAFVAGLLRDAHEGTEEAMAELREVIQSVYPPILADRGLDGALTAVITRCTVPTRLEMGDVDRVPAAVEAIVYFAVAEALTNVAKHSGATAAAVRVGRAGKWLSVVITDDGAGGADEQRGTGLAGIRRRVLALDGAVNLVSPAGGPTVLTVELPCEC